MKVSALAHRIITQIRHDKRTLGLVLIAPLLIMTVIYYIFDSTDSALSIGLVDAPQGVVERLESMEDADVAVLELSSAEAREAVAEEWTLVALDFSGETPVAYLDASDAAKTTRILGLVQSAMLAEKAGNLRDLLEEILNALPPSILDTLPIPEIPEGEAPEWDKIYVYGSEDSTFFDSFGAPMVGIIVFFLTFLIAGINFLGERTSGTLEKLLSTPIRRGEIIAGYTLGFGVLAVLQSTVVTLFVVYALGMEVAGSIWLVMLINLLTAITALTLGILLSTLAGSEFQMVQFIPTVIVPQIFLCGIFDLTGGWQIAGYFMPLYYTADALEEVMLRGRGFEAIGLDIGVLAGLSFAFVMANTMLLKRHRGV